MTIDELKKMNYWELRELLIKLIPRRQLVGDFRDDLFRTRTIGEKNNIVNVKGRKRNYKEYNLFSGQMEGKDRLLDTEEIKSSLEVSCRVIECPMPLNLDVADGFICPFNCTYCFANYFRASLYSSFFDNWRKMGLRYADTDRLKKEIDLARAGKGASDVNKALQLRIPIRFGIRFEDFLPGEKKQGKALSMLEYLRKIDYPVMINTKSDLVGSDERYIKALSENPSHSAVHITLLSTNEEISKLVDGSSPSVDKRLQAAKSLTNEGIRVVLRIEPLMILVNDRKEDVDNFIQKSKEIGVNHFTFDTYSYSAYSQGIKMAFERNGVDFDRMFLMTSDSQWLGSIMMTKFMEYFQAKGIECGTFDFGSIPSNDNDVCCMTDDCFKEAGFNFGNILNAGRKVQRTGRMTWKEFCDWVDTKGGFLSDVNKQNVRKAWNLDGNDGYTFEWIPGMNAVGSDDDGNLIWEYSCGEDFRYKKLKALINGIGE